MNFKRLTVFAILSLALFSAVMLYGISKASAASTLVVGNNLATCPNAQFFTIQSAVNAANPGDTIKVCAGAYSESVIVNKQLTILGAQAGVDARSATRTGLPATESVVDGNAGMSPFYVTASDVTIDGFTVQGATNPNQFGAGIVLGAGTSGAHVVNDIIQNNLVGLFLANNSASDQAVIQHNLIRNNNQSGPAQGTGIYSDQFVSGGNLTNVLIDSNKFSGNDDAGIDFSSTVAGSQSNITISGNEFDANGRAVVLFYVSSSQIVTNNIHNSTGSATADIRIFDGNNGLTIKCNILANGAGRAMRVSRIIGSDNSTNITVNDNNISGYPIGLVVDSGSYTGTLNAKNDWWGSPTGPTNPRNPGGTGESIVDPDQVVNFIPFRTSPVPDSDNDGILDPCDSQVGPPTTKDQCKNGGWQNFNAPHTFKNQGDCIQFVNTGK